MYAYPWHPLRVTIVFKIYQLQAIIPKRDKGKWREWKRVNRQNVQENVDDWIIKETLSTVRKFIQAVSAN